MRNEPIETPMALIGRLAALGVGQNRQSGFEEQIAQARLGYGQAMQQAGSDPSARLALLSEAMGSPDPLIRTDAMRQLADLSKTETKFVTTPGGGTSAIGMTGGQIDGVTPVIQGRAAAPTMFEVKDGENIKTFAFDPNAGTMIDVATAPRETLQRILPPEVFAQQEALRTAAGRAQGEATGAALAGVQEKSAAQAAGGISGRAAETIAQAQPLYQSAAASLLAAGDALRSNPTSREARAAYIAARDGYTTLVAQLQLPGEAVTADQVAGKMQALPQPDMLTQMTSAATGSDPLRSAMGAMHDTLAGRGGPSPVAPAAPAAGAVRPVQDMTDDEIRAELEARKAGNRGL
jgi:hypothetical protein